MKLTADLYTHSGKVMNPKMQNLVSIFALPVPSYKNLCFFKMSFQLNA